MNQHRCWFGVAAPLLFLSLAVNFAAADITRVQTLSLHKGWNAVFLEVTPTNPSPAACFQGTPVTMAAAFTGDGKSIQFVPSSVSVNQQNGWDVWYAPSRADAFLTSVFALVGNKSYLLYAEADCTLNLAGNALLNSVRWKPNAFTLTGFGVDAVSPPTFDQFFAGSAPHHPYRIYHLVNDTWVKVDNAQTTQMHSGEAYWIYCAGQSDFQGPLQIRLPVGQTLQVQGGNPSGISLLNHSINPLGVQVQNISGGATLPLAYVLRAVTDTNVTTAAYDLPDNYTMTAFDAGEKRGLWLTLRPDRMNADVQTGLLKITTDLGTQCWLPVTAERSVQTSQ